MVREMVAWTVWVVSNVEGVGRPTEDHGFHTGGAVANGALFVDDQLRDR